MSVRLLLPTTIVACLFDLDGVLTRTADLHAAAWKRTFDEFLRERAQREGAGWIPFEAADYEAYVDGKPRLDGVRSFLASRSIHLPEESPADPAAADTVHGLGRRKDELVHRLMAERGVAAYEGSLRFLRALDEVGLARAVVTSSENADAVLHAAGLDATFEVRVDGKVARELGLRGKPAPDVFLEAARRLGVQPESAAVFEDAVAGVAAGRAGRFGLVVGVDRARETAALRAAGADRVVRDLGELVVPT